jgi:16S rRNA (guanine1207-N2)-methyltransferase
VTISQGFYPDFSAWKAAGYTVTETSQTAPTAIVVVPRAKALARAMIAEAASWAAYVIVDGQKTDGIDSLYRECRKIAGDIPSLAKAHGRLFWFAPKGDFGAWRDPGPVAGPHGYVTVAGVFSDGAVDPGSALLAAALPAKLAPRVADLGAGWGYLATAVLARDGVKSLDLIEAEALSLACARQNVGDPRAAFHWADVTKFKPAKAYDVVVMNPPFHSARAAEPALGRAFISAAARMLTPGGHLWMVANRHLPYETALRAAFRVVEEPAGNGAFKIFHASRPIR